MAGAADHLAQGSRARLADDIPAEDAREVEPAEDGGRKRPAGLAAGGVQESEQDGHRRAPDAEHDAEDREDNYLAGREALEEASSRNTLGLRHERFLSL